MTTTGRFLRTLTFLLAATFAAATSQAITYRLQGFVKDPRGAGIAGVTVDLYDPVANAKATAVQNVTLATGQYDAFFTPASTATLFYLDFAPPAGTGHAAVQLKDVRMTGATIVLPDTILPDAVSLTVNVFDTAGSVPQSGVDFDAYESTTGSKIYTPGAATGVGGSVTVDIPPGLYDLLLTPPRAGPYGPATVVAQRVVGAATLSVNLPGGALLSGTVLDSRGVGVDRAALTITDPRTGALVATRYLTSLGSFSLFLAPGPYDIVVEPPAGTDLLAARVAAVPVPGSPLSITLLDGTAVSGRVTDGAGVPQWQARLEATDAVTGDLVQLSRTRIDTTGAFRFVVPPGAFDLKVSPPLGSPLSAVTIPHVVAAGTPVDLGTIVLPAGLAITGRVMAAGQPVPSANVNVFDARTGAQLPTSRDHSDASGLFRAVVPAGTYDVDVLPPRGSPWLAAVRRAVVVAGATDLGDIVLVAGTPIDATVVGQGAGPLEGASLHLIDTATGLDAVLAHHTTSSLGQVSVVAAPGSYVLRVLPPAGTTWLTLEGLGVVVGAAPVQLGTLTLLRGVLLSGFVRSARTGQALAGVNVNAYDSPTGLQVPTSHDHADFTGHYSVAVPQGTFDLRFLPPAGTRYLPATRAGVVVPGAGLVLPDVLLDEGLLLSGRTVDAVTLAPVADVNARLSDAATAAAVLTAHDHSSYDGVFETTVAPGSYVALFVPPLGSHYAVARVVTGSLAIDTNLGDILLTRGFILGGRVHDAGGAPVAGAVVTILDGAGQPVAVARNVTDAAGAFAGLVLPAGAYDVTVTPPAPTGLRALTLTGVMVSRDDPAWLDATLVAGPRVVSVSPSSGPTTGGITVTIQGTSFSGPVTVTIGGQAVPDAVITSATTITGTLPAHPRGAVDVVVTFGADAPQTLAASFTYVDPARTLSAVSPSSGPTSGGIAMTIQGTSFSGPVTVTFGGQPMTDAVVTSATTITGTLPVHPRGVVDVVVTFGTELPRTLPASFTYLDPVRTLSSVSPSSGPTAGGIAMTILGTNFAGPVTVTFGGQAMTDAVVTSATTITGTLPARPHGVVDVVVTFGTEAPRTLPASFTYVDTIPGALLMARRAGTDIVLDWTGSQASWSVFRSTDASSWGSGSLVGTTAATTTTLASEVGTSALTFYDIE